MNALSPSLLSETLIPIKKAGSHFPGGGFSTRTIERWIASGVNGIRLEICRIGRERFTSSEAIQRFLEAMNRTQDSSTQPIRRLSEREITERKRKLGIL